MKIIIIFIILFTSRGIFSQNQTFNRIPCENVHIPVCIHNIASKFNTFNNYFFEIETLKNQFKFLENDCIFLDICLVDSISDYNFYILSDEDHSNELFDLVNTYHVPNYINIFISYSTNKSTFNGISKDSKDTNYIVLSQTSFRYPLDIREQLLNYFGLLKTSNSFQAEFVNGSNSKSTVDSLWDTPADPSLLNNMKYAILPSNGSNNYYLYIKNTDPNGDQYNTMYDNFMSPFRVNFESFCTDLTRNQWQRIGYNELRNRENWWKVEK